MEYIIKSVAINCEFASPEAVMIRLHNFLVNFSLALISNYRLPTLNQFVIAAVRYVDSMNEYMSLLASENSSISLYCVNSVYQ